MNKIGISDSWWQSELHSVKSPLDQSGIIYKVSMYIKCDSDKIWGTDHKIVVHRIKIFLGTEEIRIVNFYPAIGYVILLHESHITNINRQQEICNLQCRLQ